MKKRILFLLLAVAMALSLVPMMAFTAFAADTYPIGIQEGIVNGTVTASVDSAAEGATVTVTATPDSGYALRVLSYMMAGTSGVPITKKTGENTYTFDMPAAQIVIVAYFDTGYTVTIPGTTGGTVMASSTFNASGAEVKLTVSTDAGYELDTLTVTDASGSEVDVYSPYTFTMPASNVTVTATFKKAEYNINVKAVDVANGGELAGATIQVINEGGEVKDEWKSTTDVHTVGDLKPDTYTLCATEAPEGYTLATETTFTIAADGTVTTNGTQEDETGTLLVEFAKTKIRVEVVDADTNENLKGAHLQIIDGNGNVIKEWDSTEETYEYTASLWLVILQVLTVPPCVTAAPVTML